MHDPNTGAVQVWCVSHWPLPSSSCLRWQLVDGGGERAMRSRGMHKTEMPSIFRYRGVYRGLSLYFYPVDRYTDTGVLITGLRFKGDSKGVGGLVGWLVARYRRSLAGYKLIGLLCNRGSHVTWKTRLEVDRSKVCSLLLPDYSVSRSCSSNRAKCPRTLLSFSNALSYCAQTERIIKTRNIEFCSSFTAQLRV